MKLKLLLCSLSLGTMLSVACAAEALDSATREKTVTAVADALVNRYTFPDVAEKMADRLRANLAGGEYNAFTNGPSLASRLTQDLREISRDKHLSVNFSPEKLRPGQRAEEPSPEEAAAFRENQRRENGGVDKVELLPGNIGYLHLRYFGIAAAAGPRIAGAMEFLNGTDALIIDIRNNGGAIDPGTIAILCSYFFTEERVHLNSLLWREGNRVDQSWTLPLLPGPRYLDKPVYILTSGRTFSGAEEFAYNLQTRKRATIVGARTGGGANPGGEVAVTDHFLVWVPTGRAQNPVTGTNWEGTGVSSDVEVKPAKAQLTAQKLALEQALAKSPGDDRWRSELKGRLAELEQELNRPTEKVSFKLPGFASAREACVVGSFNDWAVGINPLRKDADTWTATLELEPGRYSYKFWVDGQWMTDPQNQRVEITPTGYTNSILHVDATLH